MHGGLPHHEVGAGGAELSAVREGTLMKALGVSPTHIETVDLGADAHRVAVGAMIDALQKHFVEVEGSGYRHGVSFPVLFLDRCGLKRVYGQRLIRSPRVRCGSFRNLAASRTDPASHRRIAV